MLIANKKRDIDISLLTPYINRRDSLPADDSLGSALEDLSFFYNVFRRVTS